MEDRVSRIEEEKNRLAWENNELRDAILDMRCHSMKYNLIFSGIPELVTLKKKILKKWLSLLLVGSLKLTPPPYHFKMSIV